LVINKCKSENVIFGDRQKPKGRIIKYSRLTNTFNFEYRYK